MEYYRICNECFEVFFERNVLFTKEQMMSLRFILSSINENHLCKEY